MHRGSASSRGLTGGAAALPSPGSGVGVGPPPAAVRAGQRRRWSWVGPGPGALLYLMMLGGLTTAAVYTQANLLFWGVGLCVGGGLASVAWSLLTLASVTVERLSPERAEVGEACVLRYEVTNRSWLPAYSLHVTERWRRGGPLRETPARLRTGPLGWLMQLGPGRTAQIEARCWPTRRGPLTWERVELSTSFPFGVSMKRVGMAEPGGLLVHPQVHRLDPRVLNSATSWLGGVGEARARMGEGDEFFGLRPYRPGDGLRLVDWRRTARTGSLVARELARPVPPRVSVVLDLRATAAERASIAERGEALPDALVEGEERAISLAASLVDAAHRQGWRVGLAVLGAECAVYLPHHSPLHRTRLMESLASLDCAAPGGPALPSGFRPTVMVTSGAAMPAAAGGVTVMSADRLENYLLDGAAVDREAAA
ncbi:MAG: DUF58 domain-containing protein [Planctomycetota bacterium]